jgi:DNA-binding MarR family transcriptional regulator
MNRNEEQTHNPSCQSSSKGIARPENGTLDELGRDAAELHRVLSELLRVYQFRDRTRICCEDVSVTQCHTLSALIRMGAPSLQALADEMFLDKSTTSRVVDSLVRKGYARRVPEPVDGRIVRVEPTGRGMSLHEKIEMSLIEQEKALISDFDPEVRQATTRLIARLARAAKERFSVRGVTCSTRSAGGEVTESVRHVVANDK